MKKVITLVLALCLILSLAACGSSGGGSTTTTTTAAAGGDTTAAPETTPEAGGDEVFHLTASFHSPETNSSVIYTMQWCEEIAEASGGRIEWTYYTSGSLTSSSETFAHARDGVCDVGWSTPVLVGAQMKANSLLCTPNSGWPINEDGGEIAWKLFESSEEMQKEWEGVKVMSYYPMGATVVATSGIPVNSAADLKGVSFRATNLVTSAFVEALGANPLIISTSDVYENLSKNVISGCLIDWNLFNSFRLFEVMDYAVEDNLYSNVGAIIMNPATYDSLPADLQQIFDEHSGLYASKLGGRITAEMDEASMNTCIENGLEVVPASDTLKAEFAEAALKALEVFYKDCEEGGIDGAALVDKFAALMEEYGYDCPIANK